MSEQRTPDMLVVLDSSPNSLAPLTIAQRYARGTVLLASWNADPLEIEAAVQGTASAEPTISEALQVAAQRGMPWVGVRRDFAEPEKLLTELLVATARHSDRVVPGFAVFLAEGDPAPFRHILAIVDRSDGPISGLLAYAAVAVADTAGAKLDILVIGDTGENPHVEDELEALVINREQELYDAAVERARAQQLPVRWITAAGVNDLWRLVSDQLSQHEYDLVIDDLGDISLARVGLGHAVDGTLADGAAGEIPLKLLTQTSVPLLLVMDEIRLGLAPAGMLKAGAMAAMALAMVAAPVAAAAAASPPATASRHQDDPIGALINDLEAALATAAEEDSESRRTQDAATAGRGASADGARAQAAQQVVEQPTAYAPQAAVVLPDTVQAAAAAESPVQSQDTSTAEPPKQPTPPKPPKGGATPGQVAKAKAQAAEDRAAYEKDKEQAARTKKALAEAEEALAEAQAAAAVALADLEAATMSHAEAADHAAATTSATTGLTALLPGAPTEDQVASATLAEQAAAERLSAAAFRGEQALAALESAEQVLADEQATLERRTADVQETKADLAQSKAKVEVYKESLAETRQAPMAKGTYRLTARFGMTGGYWSSGIHTGLDFAGPTGTPIMAAASGKVVAAGYAGPYGNQITIDHGDGYQTTYSHLSSIGASVGERVSTGDQIGKRGSTGNSTGAHLHFEVTKNGKFVDPETWLGW